ncbi:MAG: cysteine synthase family protein [Planctomycetes bacterium]|nr:cysteine synthase family protein [Planctomycetota bacterium]
MSETRYPAPPTPLVPLRLEADGPVIWCKLEYLNASGSTKDRIASYILGKALTRGEVAPGGWVVEASSGSTSIAMALCCARMGLRFTAVMPEGVSGERVLMIRAYGAEVVLSPRADGIHGALREAQRIAGETGAFLPRQFSNRDNAEAHRRGTAEEILGQLPGGRVDAVVSGVGTGGTLVGLFRGFTDHGCAVRPFCARPVTGDVVSDVECCCFSARIPGVMEGLSTLYQPSRLKGLVEIEVEDEEALDVARRLIRLGYPVGPSSGLNHRAAQLAARQLPPDSVIVTVFPDRMERYFSTELFAPYR